MTEQVVYRQINKDYAYWIEKRRVGQRKGGQVSGLLTHTNDQGVQLNILFDAGLGTLEGLVDCREDAFWDQPLLPFITHGHVDHHAELMVISEIYCRRRGATMHDARPPLPVHCTEETQAHLYSTHRYGYGAGNTLRHQPLMAGETVTCGIFHITPIAVDHFEGAVIFMVEFTLRRRHKIVIGWDMSTPPLAADELAKLRAPSLALLEATTWQALDIGHTSVEALVSTGFLEELQLRYAPEEECYGGYLVHYSGWEDDWGMMSDLQLKARFDKFYPAFAPVVRVAERGQRWAFT